MKKLLSVAGKTFRLYSANEMAVYAGHATLYILMALVPMLTLVIGLVNMIPDVDLEYLQETAEKLLPDLPQVQTLLDTIVGNLNRSVGTLAVSVSGVVTLWSASKGVSAIQSGLQKISGTGDTFLRRRASALLYTVLFIALIPALLIFRLLRSSIMTFVTAMSSRFDLPDIAGWLLRFMEYSGLITAGLMVLIVLVTYTFLQGKRRKLRFQLPGAVFTTALWLGFTWGFGIFIERFWTASALYGSLAAVFLTAMWLKIIVSIVFYGGALNEALAEERPKEPTDPE